MKFKSDQNYSNILVRGHSIFSHLFAILKQKEFQQVLFVNDESLNDHAFHRNILGDVDFKALVELGKRFDISPLIHLDQYLTEFNMMISLPNRDLYLGSFAERSSLTNEFSRKAISINDNGIGPILETLQIAFYGNIDVSKSDSRMAHLTSLFNERFYHLDYERLLADLVFYLTRLGAKVIKSKVCKISGDGNSAWAIELSNFYGVCSPKMSYFFDEDSRGLFESIKRYQALSFNVELPYKSFHPSLNALWELSPLKLEGESDLFKGFLIKSLKNLKRENSQTSFFQVDLFAPFDLGAKSSFYQTEAKKYLTESIFNVSGVTPQNVSTPYLKRGDAFSIIKSDSLQNSQKLIPYTDESGTTFKNIQTISPYFFGGRSFQSVVQAILTHF